MKAYHVIVRGTGVAKHAVLFAASSRCLSKLPQLLGRACAALMFALRVGLYAASLS